jgi:hypothetical protein
MPPRKKTPPPVPSAELPYEIGSRVRLQGAAKPPLSVDGRAAPSTRPLRVFTLDPSVSFRLGGVATLQVPYEALRPGPAGALFEIDPTGAPRDMRVDLLDLDDPALLLSAGLAPTPANGRFHLQMVYAVCTATYALFRRALGREIVWACGAADGDRVPPLRVQPFLLENTRNAYYDREQGCLAFGWFTAGADPAGFTVPKGRVFTGLSHDVVVHETTHALLDALRSEFQTPTNPDVLGFHEGFADVVALLQHFSYPGVVAQAIRDARGSLSRATLLTSLAQEFGYARAKGAPSPLRTAIDVAGVAPFDADALAAGEDAPPRYTPDMEAHAMGSVLASAVFEAFVTVYRRKCERYLRIAGVDPDDIAKARLEGALLDALAQEASDVAGRFLDICIRAVDYCPPVDMELGEYLRALITADTDIVADDKWGYRDALMRSFRRRHVFPDNVRFMTEDALRWDPPAAPLEIPELAFRHLRFDGDPARPADPDEALRQAHALGRFITAPKHARLLRLVAPGEKRPAGIEYAAPPRVESVRCARRVAPDGSVLFDLVAEVTQSATVRHAGELFDTYGGCTLVIDPFGRVRYAVSKRIDSQARRERLHGVMNGALRAYWIKDRKRKDAGRYRPAAGTFRMLHAR